MSDQILDLTTISAFVEEAKSAFHSGNFHLAIQKFKQARHFYQDNDLPLEAAEMANNLSVAYLQAKQKKNALEAVSGTDSLFEEAGDIRRQAIALGNLGSAQEANKLREQAIISYKKSAELFEQCGDSEMRTTVLRSLSALQVRQGTQLESLLAMQRSLQAKEKLSLKDRILLWLLKIPFRFSGK
jgi:tetratricopeptide (TPR) repeat protein